MRCWLMLGIALLSAPPLASQEPGPADRFGSRYDAFQLLWADRGVELGTLEEMRQSERPDRWVIVSLGADLNWPSLGIDLGRFVGLGGSLLCASDGDSTFLFGPRGRLRIFASPIQVIDRAETLHGDPDLPKVTPADRQHPVFAGVQRLAFQNPGVIVGPDVADRALATLPRMINIRFTNRVAIAGGTWEQGRFLLVADQSVFSNRMIREWDNARFADNVVDYLLADRNPKNVKLLLITDRREQSELVDERFVSGDWGKTPSMRELLNELLGGLQQEDAFNEILRTGQAGISDKGPWTARRVVLIVLASIALASIVWSILSARRDDPPLKEALARSDPWTPTSPTGTASGIVPADRIVEFRQRELNQLDNYAVPLAEMARDFLNRNFGSGGWQEGIESPRLRGGAWRRWSAGRQLRKLREIALTTAPSNVSPTLFRTWQDRIRQLDTMMKRDDG